MPTLRKLLALISFVVLEAFAHAHGTHERHAPDESLQGTERGIAFALDCDAAIHELLYEYDFCIQSGLDHVRDDPEAFAAYWGVAKMRAESAAQNGYPDAAGYRDRYRAEHEAATIPARSPKIARRQ
ncbi:hypothetical protein [Niveibacterium sp. SC-1]|uniref:hypothetical protein n=1 Tax=Niveibacterium sp. SC-1 TaxID=3135646 RepID=UPI00311F3585